MTDRFDGFERMLERRLVTRAAHASRPVDAAAIARAAIATAPRRRLPWNGVLPMRASLAWVVILTALIAAAVGGALFVGALLRAPAPVPASLLAIGSSSGFFLANADGSSARQLANDGPYFVPQWSPDGTMVLASAVIGDEGNALRVFRSDGDQFGYATGIAETAWAPDSRAIALVDIADVHLRILDVASGAEVVPVLPPDARRIIGISWSPDGRRIAVGLVTGPDIDGVPTLWILDAAGGPPVAVPADGRDRALLPAWSPDGSHIAVLSERCVGAGSCSSLVRILDAASGIRVAELENLRAPARIHWSPDGSAIAVDAVLPPEPLAAPGSEPSPREVFVYAVAENTVQRVATPDGNSWLNGWAPDGGSLLVVRERDGGAMGELWRVTLGGGEARLFPGDAYGGALQPVP